VTVYICKSCGRGVAMQGKPDYCYADRMDTMENLSDNDAEKMGVFSIGGTFAEDGISYEFPRDVRFHPVTGEALRFVVPDRSSLTDLQDKVMEGVRGLSS